MSEEEPRYIPINHKGGIVHAIVSPDDYHDLARYTWHIISGYACRSYYLDGKRTTQRMHRQILNAEKGYYVDHINGDRLDNRRSNIRQCTSSQNAMNRKRTNAVSGLKGVYKTTKNKTNPYWAGITLGRKTITLGTFKNPEEAAQAYDRKAIELFGDFATTNAELQSQLNSNKSKEK